MDILYWLLIPFGILFFIGLFLHLFNVITLWHINYLWRIRNKIEKEKLKKNEFNSNTM